MNAAAAQSEQRGRSSPRKSTQVRPALQLPSAPPPSRGQQGSCLRPHAAHVAPERPPPGQYRPGWHVRGPPSPPQHGLLSVPQARPPCPPVAPALGAARATASARARSASAATHASSAAWAHASASARACGATATTAASIAARAHASVSPPALAPPLPPPPLAPPPEPASAPERPPLAVAPPAPDEPPAGDFLPQPTAQAIAKATSPNDSNPRLIAGRATHPLYDCEQLRRSARPVGPLTPRTILRIE